MHTWQADMRLCRTVGSNTSYISVPLGKRQLTEGAYYRVNAPHLSKIEWHPFSLACSNYTHRAEFIIKDLGQWTHKMHETCAKAESNRQAPREALNICGPYYAPSMEALVTNRCLLVANGIGITPFLSVIHAKVFRPETTRIHRTRGTPASLVVRTCSSSSERSPRVLRS